MNLLDYERLLRDLETRLSRRIALTHDDARAQAEGEGGDAGDASVVDQRESEEFIEAEMDTSVLQQVRDALLRIDNGTFGLCAVDREPIDEKRLKAVPWTPHCLKHQTQLEGSRSTPTL